eukprot:CAMPEP_0178401994 /NCGR_PEP_ID=MMETSP0689_2-20121128/16605_1 /TAXON_ID=160604 /ORGANISM="Amphidinium massartii, Strain CS-259" /LENGTH=41 /DNA_ID= /DNA_START= /DNA_END= /DNA_ORIENTATION=
MGQQGSKCKAEDQPGAPAAVARTTVPSEFDPYLSPDLFQRV